MRLIQYAVVNKDNGKVTRIGASLTKANAKLDEMKKANPNANLVIAHKWCSF